MYQTRAELIKEYESLLRIQLSDGNWDADPYMHGMANGMILFHQIAKNPAGDPDFKSSPEYWKRQIPRALRAIKKGIQKLWLYFQWMLASIISNITGLEFEFKDNTLIKYREV